MDGKGFSAMLSSSCCPQGQSPGNFTPAWDAPPRELAKEVMHDVTLRLVEILEQDIAKQRLDSTHVFSDMATFGRTRMMGLTIKRFLSHPLATRPRDGKDPYRDAL